MPKMRVRLQARRDIYVHNDIANAAHYFKTRIEERVSNNDRTGVGLEMVTALTMLAFAVEARFNFLGAQLISGKFKSIETIFLGRQVRFFAH